MNELAAKQIIAAREAKRWTQSEVAEKLAMALQQTYSLRSYQLLEAGVFPKYKREVVRKLDEVLGTKVYEVIYAQNYVPNSDYTSIVAEDPAPYITARRDKKISSNPENDGIIYVPVSAQAGYSTRYHDPLFLENLERLFMPGFPYRGDRYRAFDVKGDSMEPTYKEGYHLICERVEQDQWLQIANFYIYVIVLESDILVKRLYKKNDQQFAVISDNDEFYPQFILEVKDIKELWLVKRKLDWEMAPPKKFDILV